MQIKSFEIPNALFPPTVKLGWAVADKNSGNIVALFQYRVDALVLTDRELDYVLFRVMPS